MTFIRRSLFKKFILLPIIYILSIMFFSGCAKSNDFDYCLNHGKDVDNELRTSLSDFIFFFTEKPLLDSFSQDDSSAAVVFSLYKMAELGDEELTYYEDKEAYYVSSDYVREFVNRYFDLESIDYCSDNEINYTVADKASFRKVWRAEGIKPVIDSAVSYKDMYYITGHWNIPKAKEGADSGFWARSFKAVVTNKDNQFKLYEFHLLGI